MTTVVDPTDFDDLSKRRSFFARCVGAVGFLFRFIIACLACLTPVTALFVLGALQNFMRTTIVKRAPRHEDTTSHATQKSAGLGAAAPTETQKARLGLSGVTQLFACLSRNFVEGCQVLFSLALATFPFSLLWLFAWWAGWENSFNKGYEQSWVGPTVGLTGVFIALNVLAYIPMGLAHQARQQRRQSFFHVRHVASLIEHAGWRYIALALLTVIAGLPLFAAQGLPVFIEQMIPEFASYSPEQAKEVAGRFKLLTAIYIVVSLFVLRWMAARLYVRGVERLNQKPPRSGWFSRIRRGFRATLLWAILFGLVAQIFVAQFLNYQWWNWVSHPFFLLPWTR